MNDLEILLIQRYIDEYLFEFKHPWPKKAFDKRSQERWAAYEIIGRLTELPFTPPEEVIETFMFEMMQYSYVAKNKEAADLFLVARDTAHDILCLLG